MQPNTGQILRAAADRVKQRWGQSYRDGCVMNALDAVTHRERDTAMALQALASYLGFSGLYTLSIFSWNDEPGQSAACVAESLRNAADWWDEQQKTLEALLVWQ